MPGSEQRRYGALIVSGVPILLADYQRPVKKPRLPAPGCFSFLYDLMINLLEQTRHGCHDRGFDLLQVRGYLIERRAIVDRNAIGTKYVKHGPLKYVRERQDGETAIGGPDGQPL